MQIYGKENKVMSNPYKKQNDPVQQRKYEAMQADLANTQAMLDYVAMMADVEIPVMDETEMGGADYEE